MKSRQPWRTYTLQIDGASNVYTASNKQRTPHQPLDSLSGYLNYVPTKPGVVPDNSRTKEVPTLATGTFSKKHKTELQEAALV